MNKRPMAADTAFEIIRESAPTLSVGILSADLSNLGSELARLEATPVRLIHFDVMDGCFVPMMTAGPPLIRAAKTRLLKDVHLLIEDPEKKAADYVSAGADMIALHVEACPDLLPVLRQLGAMENVNDRGRGLIRGAAINPGTPLARLEPLLDHLEMVVVLALDPRVKGQGFLDSTAARVAEVKSTIEAAGRDILLCLDGGVTRENISAIARMDVDLVVSGSAVFAGGAVSENVRFMLDALKSGESRETE